MSCTTRTKRPLWIKRNEGGEFYGTVQHRPAARRHE
nr:MAG TPA: hypothetical protein [Caudoviricetes sp.]